MKKARLWLIGLAIGVIIALLAAPPTRWIVVRQVGMLWPNSVGFQPIGGITEHQDIHIPRKEEIAKQHPDDFQIQIAVFFNGQRDLEAAQMDDRLKELEERFGTKPAFWASKLRYMSLSKVRGRLPNEEALDTTTTRMEQRKLPSPEDLDEFIRTAQTGERLDPDNAFFPLMKAYGFYHKGAVSQGNDAILRAGRCRHWNDYVMEEPLGLSRLVQHTSRQSGVMQFNVMLSVLFPHYANCRSIAREVTVHAMNAELAGRPGEGLQLREAVMRTGSSMRVESRSLIGNLVGMAMHDIALSRPSGALAPESSSQEETFEERKARLREPIEAHLRKVGREDLIDKIRLEHQAHQTYQQFRFSGWDIVIQSLIRTSISWIVSIFIMANVFWLFVFYGVSAALIRWSYLREKVFMPLSAKFAWSVIMLFALWGLVLADEEMPIWFLLIPTVLIILFTFLALNLLKRGITTQGKRWMTDCLRVPATALVSVIIIFILAGIFAEAMFQNFFRENVGMAYMIGTNFIQLYPAVLLIPMILTLVFTIRGLIKRIPVSASIVYGFRAVAIPLACILVLIYGLSIIYTGGQEAALQNILDGFLEHEGRFYAERLGLEWPGPVY